MFSIEFAGGEIVFIPAEIVAEFVEESEVNFIEKQLLVAFGVVPDVAEKEENLRRHIVD